jgi:hypothetical protein
MTLARDASPSCPIRDGDPFSQWVTRLLYSARCEGNRDRA